MPIHFVLALGLVCTSVAAGFIALMMLSLQQITVRPAAALLQVAAADDMVFLFDDQSLVDASDAGRKLLASTPVQGSAWVQLCAFLTPHFPQFQSQIAGLANRGRLTLAAVHGRPLTLQAEWRAGLARISLTNPLAEGQTIALDRLSHNAMQEELAQMRGAMDTAPLLVWRQAANGDIIWANRAYLVLASGQSPDEDALTWPLPQLFDPVAAGQTHDPTCSRRAKLSLANTAKPRWFDCYSFSEADGYLHFALPANVAVQAETALREFVQTLTKTFAHLPIGLAIFDRQRQLALFNPALIDLTGLGPDFLSARPTLFSFLDRLREDQRMPEPKDYKSWRQQMAALERAASSGQYEEIWSLPSGQTYRVTGRPHPDGATALLFEDISAEMSLTRRFRAELELGQAVFDSLPEAIAVFNPAGQLVLSNVAYARVWGIDPSTTLIEVDIAQSIAHWQAVSEPSEVWTTLRDQSHIAPDRGEWLGEARLKDGRRLFCRMTPVQGGSTLIGFTELKGRAPAANPRRKSPPRLSVDLPPDGAPIPHLRRESV